MRFSLPAAAIQLFFLLGALLPRPASATDPSALMRHIEALADDDMGGRKPGTPGGERAAAYIERAFADAGLEPGSPDGGWRMPVALVERVPAAASFQAESGKRRLRLPAGEVIFAGHDAMARLDRADIIFAGYGLGEQPAGGIDVRGRIVILLPGRPPGMSDPPPLSVRAQRLRAMGAAAILQLQPDKIDWADYRRMLGGGSTRLATAAHAQVEGAISLRVWRALGRLGRFDADATVAAAEAVALDLNGTLSARTIVRPFHSPNIVGRLRGRDGDGAALLYIGHWDHLGACRRTGQDRICNGAIDNASGIAMLIELARGLGIAALPRDIYVIATTAEEMGLLGATALVDNPPVQLPRIAAVLNFDTVAIAPAGTPVATMGRGLTPIDALVDRVGRETGRAVSDSIAGNAFLQRQDGWVFTQVGIPAVMIGSGFADMTLLQRYFDTRYHAPNDDPGQPIELGGAAADVDFHIALAKLLADPAEFPLRR